MEYAFWSTSQPRASHNLGTAFTDSWRIRPLPQFMPKYVDAYGVIGDIRVSSHRSMLVREQYRDISISPDHVSVSGKISIFHMDIVNMLVPSKILVRQTLA
jgi:hypothetical protein